ncbi:hypothetical protein K440DRAFT_121856 [Wilcoxina mikolae CBS 423.85]|nr:hypothetical protein K440DRAFT_121856 [Wilcoxina mikolae CBS 423.85]
MSPVSPVSSQALARLYAFSPPPTAYHSLPVTHRAAVLVLLFADRRGDLRVVLTLRSPLLRTFAGQVALPGGKADFLSETAVQTARREAYEEIGLPLDSHHFPPPFSIEHITELPCSLARTMLGVRPCVAFLRDNSNGSQVDVEEALTPRLETNEVSSVFTVPLEQFLNRKYSGQGVGAEESWYQGNRVNWNGTRWRMHEFQAPVWERNTLKKYRVWGMTARILVDLARIAYGRDPEFDFNTEMGDEPMIMELIESGQMEEKVKKPDPELETKMFAEDIKKGNL